MYRFLSDPPPRTSRGQRNECSIIFSEGPARNPSQSNRSRSYATSPHSRSPLALQTRLRRTWQPQTVRSLRTMSPSKVDYPSVQPRTAYRAPAPSTQVADMDPQTPNPTPSAHDPNAPTIVAPLLRTCVRASAPESRARHAEYRLRRASGPLAARSETMTALGWM